MKARIAKVLWPWFSFAVILVVSARAHAVNGNWVLNGSTVNWAGNPSGGGSYKLRIGEGEVVIGGTNTALASSTVNISTPTGIIWAGPNAGACPLPTANLLSPTTSEAYYVYYGSSQLVVTIVAPTEYGIPSGALYFNPGPGCNGGAAATNYVFLGLFITYGDGSGDIVPFERSGEQVLFLVGGFASLTYSTSFNSANLQNSQNLAGLATPWVWPVTASALRLEASASNLDTQPHTIYLLDANWGFNPSAFQCAAGTPLPAFAAETFTIPAGGDFSPFPIWWSPSTSGGTTMLTDDCDTVWGLNTVTVDLAYRGYTEVIHHLDQVR